MSKFLDVARRAVGPTRPVTVLHIVTLVILAVVTCISYPVNYRIDGYYCDIDDAAARSACSGLRLYIELHMAVAAMNILMFLWLLFFKLQRFIAAVIVSSFAISTLTVFGLWVSVYFMEVSTYTREVLFVREGSGVVVNIAVMIIYLIYCALLATHRRS
jgi:hypothetical protein